ncbi:hypothetical protein DRJ17_00150 [Candidatus Woesearchaeota archaeon]|nr:MAG: hypothetical protein DRJ17_00150 [Candidatus Woesearchaeota archaeon]
MVDSFDEIEEKLKNSFQAMKADVQAVKESLENKQKLHSERVKDAFDKVKQDIASIEQEIATAKKRLDYRDDLRETVHDIKQLKLDLEKIKRVYVKKEELGEDLEKLIKLINELDANTLKKIELYKDFDKINADILKLKDNKLDVKEFDRFSSKVERALEGKAEIKDVEKFMRLAEKGRVITKIPIKKVELKQRGVAKRFAKTRLGEKTIESKKEPYSKVNRIANILLFLAFLFLVGSIVIFFLNRTFIDYFLVIGAALLIASIVVKIMFLVDKKNF